MNAGNPSPHILLTGGAGFIGSHVCLDLIELGYKVTILDNFENSHGDVLHRLEKIAGSSISVIRADTRDLVSMQHAFEENDFDAVVHLAARKSVSDSLDDPLGYFHSNLTGLQNVLIAMRASGVNRIVFSSSAAVYGMPDVMPIREDTPATPLNPYAETKLYGENLLLAMGRTHPELRVGILRYFNPVGAHSSGLIGEDPSKPPGNLVPVIGRVAMGQLDQLTVFGGNWPTPDGTGVRDYIHIQDLARGHALSLKALFERGGRSHLVNLGTGKGYSVLEVIRAYASVSGQSISYKIVEPRSGDAAVSYAATERAREVLGFQARYDLLSMCESSWKFLVEAKERAS